MHDRGHARLQRARVSAVFATAAKSVQLVSLVVTVPLIYTQLGPERCSLWAILTSISALLAFADLGLGNGLTTLLARACGRDDHQEAGRLVGGALLASAVLAVALVVVGAVLVTLLPWDRLLGVADTVAAAEATASVAVVLAVLILAIPLGLASRIRQGLQQGHIAALWEGGGQLLGLAGVLLCVRSGAGVPELIAAGLGLPLLIQACHFAWLLMRAEPWLRPQRMDINTSSAIPVLRSGLLFLVLQISTAVLYSFDALFAAHLQGAVAAANLTVVQRAYVVPTVLITLALTPLWPAYGEALARGDSAWATRVFHRSLMLTALAGVVVLAATPLFADGLLAWWLGSKFQPERDVNVACAAACALSGLAHAVSMLLNGAGRIAYQAGCGVVLLLLVVPGKCLLAWWLGTAGFPWASALLITITIMLPSLWLAEKRILTPPPGAHS